MNITIPRINEKTVVLPGRNDIGKGVLLAALAAAQLPGMRPLGVAFAATFPAENAYIALLGLCAGTAAAKLSAIKYILAFFIYYILIFMKKTEDKSVRAVAVGVSVAFAGLISFFWTGFSRSAAILLLPEAALSGGAYRIFAEENSPGMRGAADLLIIGGVLNGLKDFILPYINMNVSVFAAFVILMCIGYACDLPEAAAAGLVVGFVMHMNEPECIDWAGMLAAAALLSASLAGMGKCGVAAGFLCGLTVCVLYSGSLGGMRIIDIFMPLAVFVLLPESVHYRISGAIQRRARPDYGESDINSRVASQLRTVAKAVCDLADGVTFTPRRAENSEQKEVFDTVMARVCRGCRLERNCRKKDNWKTYDIMQELWKTMETDGFCDHTNMPRMFGQVCMRSESFLSEFRHAYEMYKQNALYRGEALSGRDIMARQYGEISNVINMLSHEVENGAEERESAEKYRVSVFAQQEPKQGQAVCGDTLIHFAKGGKYYVILCDGMGCGEAALAESRLTARLFTEFLKAGFEKETAVNMINSALALKADKESFSTVDLLEINLETGVCEFLKIGSAQSFLKTKSDIEVISSKALPIGILESVEVTAEQRALKNNDMILMVSDGVGEAGSGVLKNEWIKKMIMLENRDDNELAKLILVGAKARMLFSDDITSVVIRINRKNGE